MPADIFIVGMSHLLQCSSTDLPEGSASAFEAELRKLLAECKIKRIVEEMSPEGLRKHKVGETVAQRLGRELDISHQVVDLTSDERSALSLDDATLFQTMSSFGLEDGTALRQGFDDLIDGIRERVWIARVLSKGQWPVLFICGSQHAVSLRRLWRCMGFDSKVVHIDYKP